MDIYAAALPGCPGLGAKNIRELIDHFNTPEDVWNASEKDIIDLHVLTPAREKAFLKYRRETDGKTGEKAAGTWNPLVYMGRQHVPFSSGRNVQSAGRAILYGNFSGL